MSYLNLSTEPRAKDPGSLKKKLDGKRILISKITDLAGVRIITYFPSDVDRIVDIVTNEFCIDYENSIDKRKVSDPAFFGYVSVHLIVEFKPQRLDLTDYKPFKKMKCEIQIRTILQHAWAEIEHDTVYKSSQDIPFEIRRKFSSLAGLLEIADREFETLKKDEIIIRNKIKNSINNEALDRPIDLDTIKFYFEKYHGEKKINPEKFRYLNKLIHVESIKTIKELDNILTPEALNKADNWIENNIDEYCTKTRRNGCLLRYVIAIGNVFEYKLKDIGVFANCYVIQDLKLKKL